MIVGEVTLPSDHEYDAYVGVTGSIVCPVSSILDYRVCCGSQVGLFLRFSDEKVFLLSYYTCCWARDVTTPSELSQRC